MHSNLSVVQDTAVMESLHFYIIRQLKCISCIDFTLEQFSVDIIVQVLRSFYYFLDICHFRAGGCIQRF